jgi:N-acetyl-gamma-glutamyl-phosphate reductase
MIKAGIIGAAGYTGGETLRLLISHPEVELVFAQSESQAGKKIYQIHQDLFGSTELAFVKEHSLDVDVLFLCKGHHESKAFLEKNEIPSHIKIIDLSQDFRHQENANFKNRTFVYGLPELQKGKIKNADAIANPGCFATCIQLAVLPLAKEQLIQSNIHVSATTGSTGAGQAFSETNHFSWRSNNHSGYKLLTHQHEKEIMESIQSLQLNTTQLQFIPQRGAFTRGIYSVSYLKSSLSLNEAVDVYQTFYNEHPFTHVVPFDVNVKQVVNTNNCFISLQKEKDDLIIISAIDNLLKGAAGQAVQNMNLLFNLNESAGLNLKPSAF